MKKVALNQRQLYLIFEFFGRLDLILDRKKYLQEKDSRDNNFAVPFWAVSYFY